MSTELGTTARGLTNMKCGDGMRFPRNTELYCERVWESKRELCHIENGYVVPQVREHL